MPQVQESEEDTIRKAEESRETTMVLFDRIQPGTPTKAVSGLDSIPLRNIFTNFTPTAAYDDSIPRSLPVYTTRH
jgi:hypothetical protein